MDTLRRWKSIRSANQSRLSQESSRTPAQLFPHKTPAPKKRILNNPNYFDNNILNFPKYNPPNFNEPKELVRRSSSDFMMHYTGSAPRATISGQKMENFIHRHSKVPLEYESEKNNTTDYYKKVLTPFDAVSSRVKVKRLNKTNELMETKNKRDKIKEKFKDVYTCIKPPRVKETQVKQDEIISQPIVCEAVTKRTVKTPLEDKKEINVKPCEVQAINGNTKDVENYIRSFRLTSTRQIKEAKPFHVTPKKYTNRNINTASTQRKYSEVKEPNTNLPIKQPNNMMKKYKEKKNSVTNVMPRKKWNHLVTKPINQVKYQKYIDVFAKDRVTLAKQLQGA